MAFKGLGCMDAVLCELVSKSTVSSGACVAHAALWAAGHHCHAEAIPPTSFKRGNALSVALRMEDRKMPLTHNRGTLRVFQTRTHECTGSRWLFTYSSRFRCFSRCVKLLHIVVKKANSRMECLDLLHRRFGSTAWEILLYL